MANWTRYMAKNQHADTMRCLILWSKAKLGLKADAELAVMVGMKEGTFRSKLCKSSQNYGKWTHEEVAKIAKVAHWDAKWCMVALGLIPVSELGVCA